MKEIYTKQIDRLPDSYPVRSEKAVEVDSTDGKVTDIYIVDHLGKKRIDLDGNVKESHSKTVTQNGTVTIDKNEYGQEYTSVKEVEVVVDCPTIDNSATVTYTENGTYTIEPTGTHSGIASASVTVNVPDTGDITSFEGIQQASSLSGLADFANRCACVGALLSHDNGTFTIWNGDSTAADYWDPQATTTSTPSTQYGTVIAVCAGKGLWVIPGTGSSKKFAPEETDLYNYFLKTCVTGNGWDNTQHILTNYYTGHENDYEGTIWEWMKGVESDNSVLANHLFIPNAEELRKVCFNTMDDVYTGQSDVSEDSQSFGYSRNIEVLLGLADNNFWSSSQYCDSYDVAYYVNFGSGDVDDSGKASKCYSLALLHFEDQNTVL